MRIWKPAGCRMQHQLLRSSGRNISMKFYKVQATDRALADMEEILATLPNSFRHWKMQWDNIIELQMRLRS
mgnify:CR=1 FL=1